MHVVQVLVLLAVEDVVVDDLETSKARARRGPPMTRGVFSEFAESAPTLKMHIQNTVSDLFLFF